MEITIKINGQAVPVEISTEETANEEQNSFCLII